jgi:lipid-binding SYLF domain-containing protein
MRSTILVLTLMLGGFAAGCATEPTPATDSKKDALSSDAQSALSKITADAPNFNSILNDAYGYVIFPSVGKGGLGVGGAYGKGEVYEQGRLIGYADITQLTIGLQAGGQSFSEVILFQNKEALDRFTSKRYEPTAQASAVALTKGASANARYTDGVAVFTHAQGGLMGEASVGGQRFNFTPLSASSRDDRL